MSYPTSLPATPTIALTQDEQTLVDLLVECAAWIDLHPQQVDALRLRNEETGDWIGKERGAEPVELRIAGGWVRDKLLGRQSDDVDVSTSPDPITGLKFAMLFEQYLETLGKRDLMGRLTKIEAKPEQSKHLETATARVCNLSVDWVQQRGQEVYTEGSRIPTVAFGTPVEDAERRDLTINSLFYNLRTRLIEDQTGKGLADLGFVPGMPRKIRTPLEPVKTFHDDPLRVIRAVRFAARFGREWELDSEMEEAIKREEIKEALRNPLKISRERVGAELEKMLLGRDPYYAFELIQRLELHPLIFLYEHDKVFAASELPGSVSPSSATAALDGSVPRPTMPPEPDTSLSVAAAAVLTRLLYPSVASPAPPLPALHPFLQLAVVPLPEASASLPLPSAPPVYPPASPSPSTPLVSCVYPATIKRLFLSCGLLPLYGLSTLDKGKPIWVGEKVVREGVKGPTVDIQFSKRARDAEQLLRSAVRTFAGEGRQRLDAGEERAEIGMVLRHVSVHDGQHQRWNVSLLWALCVDIVEARADPSEQTRLVEAYNSFVRLIESYHLDVRAFDHPLLDGKALNALLPFSKSSPAMPAILSMIVRYQLARPDATIGEVEVFLREKEDELKALVESSKPAPKGKKRKGAQKEA